PGHYRHTAHGGRARLGQLALGTLLTNRLTDAVLGQPRYEVTGSHERGCEAQPTGHEQCDHRYVSRCERSASPSSSRSSRCWTVSPTVWVVSCPLPATS